MTRSYRTGRGKPPKETQFQKGQSGNPSGRPRKASTPAVTSRVARQKMIDLSKELVRTTQSGREIDRETWDAANAVFKHMAFKGGYRAMRQFRQEIAQAAAEEEQERADQYAFWRKWKRDHDGAKLYSADHPDRKLPWPHPVDIRIDAIGGRVSFSGPLDADELPLYRAVVEVADLYLIEAELIDRPDNGLDPLVRHLRLLAFDAYLSAAPSLGGSLSEQERPALLHRLTALVLDIRAMGTTALHARRAELFSSFYAALATIDRPVPHGPPLRHAAPARRTSNTAPKKRHRLCSISRNDELRQQIHDRLSNGQGVKAVAKALARTRTSQSVVARYCQLYKRILQSWSVEAGIPAKDQPTSLKEFKRAFAQFQLYLGERDIADKERLRRSELPLKPDERPRPGASQETIDFLKGKLLGFDVEPPPEMMD